MTKKYKQYYTVVIERGNDENASTYSFNTLSEAEDFYDSMIIYSDGSFYSSITLNRVLRESLNG